MAPVMSGWSPPHACPTWATRSFCLELDESKVRTLNKGDLPIHEPGLAEIVRRNMGAGRLQFTTDVALAVEHGRSSSSASGRRRQKTGPSICDTCSRRPGTSGAT
jgi:UDP-glucose 6-dehydrogenase